jgi:hypothetical protein
VHTANIIKIADNTGLLFMSVSPYFAKVCFEHLPQHYIKDNIKKQHSMDRKKGLTPFFLLLPKLINVFFCFSLTF